MTWWEWGFMVVYAAVGLVSLFMGVVLIVGGNRER